MSSKVHSSGYAVVTTRDIGIHALVELIFSCGDRRQNNKQANKHGTSDLR